MSTEATLARLLELAGARFGREAGSLSATTDMFHSLGVDSVQLLELLSELEQEFGVEIPDYELRGITTFGELSAVISRRL